jgi:miniconductance mechanosensitive channel
MDEVKIENLKLVDKWIFDLLQNAGFSDSIIPYVGFAIELLIVIAIVILIDFIARKIILNILNAFAQRSKVTWDDVFMKHNVFRNIAHLVPILAINTVVSSIMPQYTEFIESIGVLSSLVFIWLLVLTINSVINSLLELSKNNEKYFSLAIQSLSQLVNIVVFIFALIATFSVLLKVNIETIFGTLGALTAVIILVFKDTILGFVASIQLSLSKMVKIGDWIVLPSYNADGPLIELNLMTAKIQNWDKTITTVPTYALISSAVKNWDGMTQSGVRRIMRSISFDVNTVKFLEPNELEDLKRISILKSFIEEKQSDIELFNREKGFDTSIRVNGRRQTNIGVFRKYAELYLSNRGDISKDETLMVRQLEQDKDGLKLQVYCFVKNTVWVEYEGIQSDIFDHLISSSREFGLELFQNPTGKDFNKL